MDGTTRRRLSIGLLVVLATGSSALAGGRAAAGPRIGEPCRSVQRYPVSFTADAGGTYTASFAFAGGAAQGRAELPDVEGRTLAGHGAYVADVRLGSYEPAGPASGLTCRVGATYHFYCPATAAVDQLCITPAGGHGRSWPGAGRPVGVIRLVATDLDGTRGGPRLLGAIQAP